MNLIEKYFTKCFWICCLLGPDNSSVRYYILTLFLSWFIRYIEAKKSLSEMAAFLNFGVFVFMRSIGSGMVAFACMAVFIIMGRIKLVYDRVKLYHIFAGRGLLFLLLMTINNFAGFKPLFTLIGKEMVWRSIVGENKYLGNNSFTAAKIAFDRLDRIAAKI